MKDFDWIYQHALNRKGGVDTLEALLPVPATNEVLCARPDSYYLSCMSLRIFSAGLRRSMVEARWPAFEEVFFGFEPQKLELMSDEMLEKTLQDQRLIRHWGKIKSIRTNATMVARQAEKYGSFGRFLAEWPTQHITELWRFLAKQGAHLGGNSAPYFLRMVGKDTFMLSTDVVAALKAQEVVDKKPTSQRDLKAVQSAFDQWQVQSGRPLCQISRLLSFCAD